MNTLNATRALPHSYAAQIVSTDCTTLREKLGKVEASIGRMRRVNSLVRNRNRRGLLELGYTEQQIEKFFAGDAICQGGFFPAYKLRNTAAAAREIKQQLLFLEECEDLEPEYIEAGSFVFEKNPDRVVLCFRFYAKPNKAQRALLRKHAFERSAGEFTYENVWSEATLKTAMSIFARLDC